MADREKVFKGLKYLHDKDTWREGIMIHDDHARVRKQITEDALALLKEQEAVVRCKDCKHWNRRECGSYGTCESENMNICGFTDADWFCADRERKTD